MCDAVSMTRQRDQQRVAAYVAARRGTLSLSQTGLAEAAGVDPKTVWSLESGERWPIAKNRSRIEQALGWSPGDLDRIAAGGEPSVDEGGIEAALAAAVGRPEFDDLARKAIAALDEPERSVVERLFASYVSTQRSNQEALEKLIVLHHHVPRGTATQEPEESSELGRGRGGSRSG